jgi:hypothetical protein
LSWRVLILPYLGHQELFDQFKVTEPWYTPHNKRLIDKIPSVFLSPERRDTKTNYLAVVGGSAAEICSRFSADFASLCSCESGSWEVAAGCSSGSSTAFSADASSLSFGWTASIASVSLDEGSATSGCGARELGNGDPISLAAGVDVLPDGPSSRQAKDGVGDPPLVVLADEATVVVGDSSSSLGRLIAYFRMSLADMLPPPPQPTRAGVRLTAAARNANHLVRSAEARPREEWAGLRLELFIVHAPPNHKCRNKPN